MSPPRVGLIGARRVRQGLGPFVARDLVRAGAQVPCFLARSQSSCEPGERELRERVDVLARGYADFETMVERERLDALAILSPSATHEGYLEAAADAGLHVLCEKPLVWEGDRLAERGHASVNRFRERNLLLVENCQWPYTLDAFRTLHPEVSRVPERFAMRLSPDSAGLELLGDCLPHPLSVLQALAPSDRAQVEDVRFEPGADERAGMRVDLGYRAGGRNVDVSLELRPGTRLPRAASLTIDGHHAERRIDPEHYAMSFACGERVVPIADPLSRLVADFVSRLESVLAGTPPADPTPIDQRMQLLGAITEAYAGAHPSRVDASDPASA